MVKITYNLVPGASGLGKRDEDEPMPGPSDIGPNEDGEDYSSGSDWHPGKNDYGTSDSDTEMTEKSKSNRKARSNKKTKTTKTSSKKAKDVAGNVNPQKILQQIHNTQNGSVEKSSERRKVLQNLMQNESVEKSSDRRNVLQNLMQNESVEKSSDRRKILQNLMQHESVKNSSVVLCKQRSSERVPGNSEVVKVKVQDMSRITEMLCAMLTTVSQIKKHIRPGVQSKVALNTSPSIQSKFRPKEESYEDKENFSNDFIMQDELNRSGDNVLISNKYKKVTEIPEQKEGIEEGMVPIGSGATLIPIEKFKQINWKTFTIATRQLLVAVFARSVLATHSLTGKRSPAFRKKKGKMGLDERKVADIIWEITDRFDVKANYVRLIITTKCADESKMARIRNKKARNSRN